MVGAAAGFEDTAPCSFSGAPSGKLFL